jgi:hypothetical protein
MDESLEIKLPMCGRCSGSSISGVSSSTDCIIKQDCVRKTSKKSVSTTALLLDAFSVRGFCNFFRSLISDVTKDVWLC